MSDKLWMGSIYVKEEGGYEIILKSLTHYKKRLQTIQESPELKEAAAMFAPLLQTTARKKIPDIVETKEKVYQLLLNSIPAKTLEENLEILQKALECRQADIQKAEETGLDYFIKLLGDVSEAKKDVVPIKEALIKINQYSQ